MAKTNTSEPLFHIVKRDNISNSKKWIIRIVAIVLALILCAVITTLVTGENPIAVYQAIFKGAFGSDRKSWVTMQNVAILLIISLALTPAFKMQFWNIGGEGQVLMGALAAAACMINLDDKLSPALVIVCMVISSIVAGAVWGLIPALFKAKWNTNETLATLMMNYIATQIVAYYVIVWEVPKGSGTIGIINQMSNVGWLPHIGDNKYLLSIVVALLVTVFMYIYLGYTKHGYEISVVGESQNTARYVGIKVEKVIIRTMLLSGAVCGLAEPGCAGCVLYYGFCNSCVYLGGCAALHNQLHQVSRRELFLHGTYQCEMGVQLCRCLFCLVLRLLHLFL